MQELVDLSVELDLTGFDMPEIDLLLDLDLPFLHLSNADQAFGPYNQSALSERWKKRKNSR